MDLNDFIKVELIQDDEKDDLSKDEEPRGELLDDNGTKLVIMQNDVAKLEHVKNEEYVDEYVESQTDQESDSSEKSSSDFKPPSSLGTDPFESDEETLRVLPLRNSRKRKSYKKLFTKTKAERVKKSKPAKPKRSIVSCGCCNEEFTAIRAYKNHFSINHNTDTLSFNCPICSKNFSEQGLLQNHRRSCLTKDSFEKCSICDKLFRSSSLLKKHVARIHSDEKRYQCADCIKAFRTKADLKAHSVVHIPMDMRKSYMCEQCGRSFTLKRNYLTHLKVHNDPQIFICELCGNTFKTKGNLKSHQVHHTGEKKHSCPLCEKCFASKAYLKVHILLHSNIKLHKCDICGKDFARKSILTKHLYVHSGIRPHPCQFCHKAFRAKDKLVVHERIHTGEKPYKCEFCPVAFCESGNLQKHKRNVHKFLLAEVASAAAAIAASRDGTGPQNSSVNASHSNINDNRTTEYSAGNAAFYGSQGKDIERFPNSNSFDQSVVSDGSMNPALNSYCAPMPVNVEIAPHTFMALQ